MHKKYKEIILGGIIDKINESSDLTKQEKNNYKKAINGKSENEINEILDGIKNLVGNNLNEKYIKAHVHIGHGPIGNPDTAKYIILGTFPGVKTLKNSNRENIVYYCDTRNKIRTILKDCLSKNTDDIKATISTIQELQSDKSALERSKKFLNKFCIKKNSKKSKKETILDNIEITINKKTVDEVTNSIEEL